MAIASTFNETNGLKIDILFYKIKAWAIEKLSSVISSISDYLLGDEFLSSNQGMEKMLSIILRTTAAILAMGAPAFASSQTWNVTEEGKGGVKSSQGTWTVSIDAENKISGKAEMQSDKGGLVGYTINGSVKDSLYTVNLADRSDGKKDCVWSGRAVAHADTKSHGLIGDVHCASNDFIIRAGF